MPVPLIPCRNTVTGATAEIPQTALRHLSNWAPIDADAPSPEPGEQGAASPAADAQPAAQAADSGPDTAAQTRPAAPAGKSKAAKATTSSKEESHG